MPFHLGLLPLPKSAASAPCRFLSLRRQAPPQGRAGPATRRSPLPTAGPLLGRWPSTAAAEPPGSARPPRRRRPSATANPSCARHPADLRSAVCVLARHALASGKARLVGSKLGSQVLAQKVVYEHMQRSNTQAHIQAPLCLQSLKVLLQSLSFWWQRLRALGQDTLACCSRSNSAPGALASQARARQRENTTLDSVALSSSPTPRPRTECLRPRSRLYLAQDCRMCTWQRRAALQSGARAIKGRVGKPKSGREGAFLRETTETTLGPQPSVKTLREEQGSQSLLALRD